MKKILILCAAAAGLLTMNTSCSDYLDIVPDGVATIDNAFSNRTSAKKFLYTCYSYLPALDQVSQNPAWLAGDEYWLTPKGTGRIEERINLNGWEIALGNQNTNEPWIDYWDGNRGGKNLWIAIRDCNIFLNNIDRPKDIEEYEKTRWKAEVKFLKAYYHFFLAQMYGPIPIMDDEIPVDAPIEEVRRYRDSFDDVINYVVETIDECISDLPLSIVQENLELGRITQPIAAAVKAQALLFAASPLMNGNPDYANFVDGRGEHIFPTEYDATKWKRAADAAMEAIQIAEEAGHRLYTYEEYVNISDATRRILSIKEAVTERWNDEIIWGSTQDCNGLQTVSMPRLSAKKSPYALNSVMGPTLDVAEQFYTSNGVPMSEDKTSFWAANYGNRYKPIVIPDEGDNKHLMEVGQETATMHLNREPRFYANLFFDRCTWYGDGMTNDTMALDKIHFRYHEYSGIMGIEKFTMTGYLPKKLCSMKSVVGENNDWSPYRYAFPIIRLADVYLMYAEALNESLDAPTEEVYEYVDRVRERAGLEGVKDSWAKYSRYPNKPLAKDGMREIIHQERLNELAFEGKRFWDYRRWKVEQPQIIRGWNVKGETVKDFYQPTQLYTRPQKYYFRDYLWPIRTNSIQKNPNLVQNPGWN